MPDSFTEYSSQSIFGRLGNSIMGVLFGLILIPIAVLLLTWNEGRALKTATSLKEGVHIVVSVPADTVQPVNDRKLIHLAGEATTADKVRDPMFAMSANAIRLTRNVEMFQWKEESKSETHKDLGGGTETRKTYTYSKAWSDKLIRSAEFKHPDGHKNPGSMIASTSTMLADRVTLGAFRLPRSILAKMGGDKPFPLANPDLEKIPKTLRGKAKLVDESFYFGADPAAPEIGDQRVKFTILKPAVFSILARQTGETLDPYPTRAGREIERVESGDVSADAMFQHAVSENTMITWGIRAGGMLLMALGMGLILSPIATVADVIPFFGSIVEAGVTFAAVVLAMAGSLVVIAVAWFAVRPILSGVIIVGALGALVFGKSVAGKKRARSH